MKKTRAIALTILAASAFFLAACQIPTEKETGDDSRAAAAKPVAIAPVGVSHDLHPVFSWQPMAGATKYWVLVGDGAQVASSNIIMDVGNITATTYASTGVNFQIGKTYYWKVKGITSGTNGAWSAVVSFTIQDPYGQTKTIKAGTPIPANWVIVDITEVKNVSTGVITIYYIIKYLGNAAYGDTVKIDPYGVDIAPIPPNWVIIDVASQINGNGALQLISYTIEYLGGAVYRNTVEIEPYAIDIAPIPPNWVIISITKKSNDIGAIVLTSFKIEYLGGAPIGTILEIPADGVAVAPIPADWKIIGTITRIDGTIAAYRIEYTGTSG
jgi:predicted small secreted protein